MLPSVSAVLQVAGMSTSPAPRLGPGSAIVAPAHTHGQRCGVKLAAANGIPIHETKLSHPMSVSALSSLQRAPGVSPVLLGSFHHLLEHYLGELHPCLMPRSSCLMKEVSVWHRRQITFPPSLLLLCSLLHHADRCPTAGKSIEVAARGQPASTPLFFDHFAFRTFGVTLPTDRA